MFWCPLLTGSNVRDCTKSRRFYFGKYIESSLSLGSFFLIEPWVRIYYISHNWSKILKSYWISLRLDFSVKLFCCFSSFVFTKSSNYNLQINLITSAANRLHMSSIVLKIKMAFFDELVPGVRFHRFLFGQQDNILHRYFAQILSNLFRFSLFYIIVYTWPKSRNILYKNLNTGLWYSWQISCFWHQTTRIWIQPSVIFIKNIRILF